MLREFESLMICEGHAWIDLSYVVNSSDNDQYTAVRTTGDENDENSVNCWPEAIINLLCMYETSGAIREGILAMEYIRQK